MPSQYLKNAQEGISRRKARGNSSKANIKYYARFGGGKRGRRFLGNARKPKASCPCHPVANYYCIRRLHNKLAVRAELNAMRT